MKIFVNSRGVLNNNPSVILTIIFIGISVFEFSVKSHFILNVLFYSRVENKIKSTIVYFRRLNRHIYLKCAQNVTRS